MNCNDQHLRFFSLFPGELEQRRERRKLLEWCGWLYNSIAVHPHSLGFSLYRKEKRLGGCMRIFVCCFLNISNLIKCHIPMMAIWLNSRKISIQYVYSGKAFSTISIVVSLYTLPKADRIFLYKLPSSSRNEYKLITFGNGWMYHTMNLIGYHFEEFSSWFSFTWITINSKLMISCVLS